jgi:hypothetical protein
VIFSPFAIVVFLIGQAVRQTAFFSRIRARSLPLLRKDTANLLTCHVARVI